MQIVSIILCIILIFFSPILSSVVQGFFQCRSNLLLIIVDYFISVLIYVIISLSLSLYLSGHLNNSHCLAKAINALAGAMFTIYGPGDLEERLKEFLAVSFITDLQVVFLFTKPILHSDFILQINIFIMKSILTKQPTYCESRLIISILIHIHNFFLCDIMGPPYN